MKTTSQSAVGSESRLAQVLDDYLAAVERGASVDRSALLTAHPDLAEDLEACLASLDFFRAASPADGPGNTPDGAETCAARLGDFRIVRELGRGGMGVVYEAHQHRLDRRVALKVVLAGRFAPSEDLRRFRIEAEAAAHLDHPNIVPIYEVGEQAGLPFFSMKLLDGGSLADRLGAYHSDLRSAAALAAEIARAVHHAHQRGILHRDLKPSNILLDADGRPHVTDFGLAKRLGSDDGDTRTGALLGSPPYMSPEQVVGDTHQLTTATDVYGLGAILYTVLTGRPPFGGASVVETIERVKAGTPDPPSRLNRQVDADLEAICLKALEKAPHERYRSAEEFAEDLDRWGAGQPTLARPLPRFAQYRRWAWRRRRQLAIASAALLVLVLVGFGTWQTERLRRSRALARQQAAAIRQRDEDIRLAQYVADIHRVPALDAMRDTRRAIELLDRHGAAPGTTDLRGFEWYYLRGMVEAHRASWIGHEGRDVYHVEYAPNGLTLASAGGDGTARIWDADTGRQRYVVRGHNGDVNWVSFDPAGRLLVTAGDDGTVRVWDASNGRALKIFEGGSGEVVTALFTRDGNDVIAATRDRLVVRWDAVTGVRRAEVRHSAGLGAVESLAISPEGTTLALATRGLVVLHRDLREGRLADIVTPTPTPDCQAYGVAFAPDGRTVAATGKGFAHAFLYHARSGQARTTLEGPTARPLCAAFSPDGRTLTLGDAAGALRLWDLESRSCRATLLGHTDQIWCVAFAPDGRTVATSSKDGTIRTWDATGRPDRIVFRGLKRGDTPGNQPTSIAFAHGATRVLAANGAGDVLACDLSAGTTRVLRQSDPQWMSVTALLSPHGSKLAVSGQLASASDAVFTVVLHDLLGDDRPVTLGLRPQPDRLIWAPDGKRLAVADQAGYMTLWDTTGRLLGRADFGIGQDSSSAAFLPAGDVLIAQCGETFINPRPFQFITWNLAEGHIARDPRPALGLGPKMVVASDGRSLASLAGPWVLDYPSLKEKHRLIGHNDDATDLAFAPDGRTIATASLDHTVRLWNVATGQQLLTLEGHSGPVRAVVFSPDGCDLASCGDGPDGGIEVVVWRGRGHGDETADRAGRRD